MKTEQIKPTLDNVFVELVTKQSVTAGGIHLPDTAKMNQQDRFGTILALGPTAAEALLPLKVAVGMHVIVNFFEGTNVTMDVRHREDERYKILPAKNIKAIVEPDLPGKRM